MNSSLSIIRYAEVRGTMGQTYNTKDALSVPAAACRYGC
jgi:hypothetical protein